MADDRISPFKLGVFVLLGLGLGGIALVFVGLIDPLKERQTYVSFFDTPVEGLESGAAVRYLGIQVGKVRAIDLGPRDRMVKVQVKIRNDFQMDDTMFLQLSPQLVTGLTTLTLRRAEDAEVIDHPELPFDPDYPVLPNRPSDMDQILETARLVAEKMGDADLNAIGDVTKGWSLAGNRLADLLADPDLQQTLENVRDASTDLQAILQALGDEGAPAEWRKILLDLSATAGDLRSASETLATQLDGMPPGSIAEISGRLEGLAATGEEAVRSWDHHVSRSMSLLERNLQQFNRLMSEFDRLVRSLRREPGQILERRKDHDPFER